MAETRSSAQALPDHEPCTTMTAGARTGVLQIAAALAVAYLAIPLIALITRTPWTSFGDLLTSTTIARATGLSLLVSLAATALSVAFGTPLAMLLATTRPLVAAVLRPVVLLPIVLPPVIGGASLLFALGRRGLIGQWLDEWFGVALPFTTAGAIAAATFVALPFYVIAVENAARAVDPELIEAAETMGADRTATLRHVVLPIVRPAAFAGAALAWARAIGEFGATVTFAGNLEGRTQTLPLATFQALQGGRTDEALVMSMVLLIVSVVLLASLRSRFAPDS